VSCVFSVDQRFHWQVDSNLSHRRYYWVLTGSEQSQSGCFFACPLMNEWMNGRRGNWAQLALHRPGMRLSKPIRPKNLAVNRSASSFRTFSSSEIVERLWSIWTCWSSSRLGTQFRMRKCLVCFRNFKSEKTIDRCIHHLSVGLCRLGAISRAAWECGGAFVCPVAWWAINHAFCVMICGLAYMQSTWWCVLSGEENSRRPHRQVNG
jgi:hypothetical protein